MKEPVVTARAIDVLRFSVGTLTAIPVKPPRSVDRKITVPGILLAPLFVLPLGLAVGLVLWIGREAGLAPIAVAATAVGVLALGSRAFHLDGLADTADALTCGYDPERSLEIMKRGDAGPAGASALVLVLGIQIGALASIQSSPWGPLVAVVLVCVARGVASVMSLRGVPAARSSGLASTYASTMSPAIVAGIWVVWIATMTGVLLLDDRPWWLGLVCAAGALSVAAWLIRRAMRRLGGVAGDVYGAAVEISLAVMLLLAS